jgi:hypothetical protein
MTKQDTHILADRWKKEERLNNGVKEATAHRGFEREDWNDQTA